MTPPGYAWDRGVVRATPALIAGMKDAPASLRAVGLALLNLKDGGLVVHSALSPPLGFGDPAAPLRASLMIRDPRFARRVIQSGDIGFAEGFMAGEWETPDLSALLTLFSNNIERIRRMVKGGWLGRAAHLLVHLGRENTRIGARKNILAHYDLGNRFYERWLDPSMTYSSAKFERPGQDIGEAQLAKYRGIAEALRLAPDEHVLEIGCGWGGFAEVAAKEFGARVTGLTLSDAQAAFARARMQRLGLADRVDIRVQDYRDVEGPFDKVASIEMFEAVGERYWPDYFSKVAGVLRPGGRAGLQIITIRDDLFRDYRKRADFIQRYVFPGGMLPSMARLREEVGKAGLQVEKAAAFGQSYAETLALWGERFRQEWSSIRALGFDERFKKMWEFYLSYCEAGFRSGRTDVVQIALAKP